jgi:DNA-binding CsgD family transcriptional regulator
VDRWLEAFNAQDLDALCEIADPAIEIIPIDPAETAPSGTVYRGHSGLRTLFGRAFEHFSQLRLDYTSVEANGDLLLVDLHFTLAVNGEGPSMTHASTIYEIAGDRLKRVEAFTDATVAREALTRSTLRLSARELEIVGLLAHGRTAEDAAQDLTLSPHTVRTHIRNAKEKLGAHTSAELVAMAMRTGAVRD